MTDRRIQVGEDGRPIPPADVDFNANDALELVKIYNTKGDEELRQILEQVLRGIKASATKGEREVMFAANIYRRHRDGLINLLKQRNFTVTTVDDQREGSYLKVMF
jgi:hypothetical protein